jgi:hypothetical protein
MSGEISTVRKFLIKNFVDADGRVFLPGYSDRRSHKAAAKKRGVAMRVEDYYPKSKRWWVRLHEKGGKRHEMPAHHDLETYLDAYIKAGGIGDDGKSPLFRSAVGRTDTLTEKPMNRVDAWRMVQRRAADLEAGLFQTQAEMLRLYRFIATMDAKAPLPSLADQKPTWAAASSFARTWGLNQLADHLDEKA